MVWTLFAICALMGFRSVNGVSGVQAGPFKVKINAVVKCETNAKKTIIIDPKIRKFNRTTFIVSSPINLTIPFDDNLEMLSDIAVQTPNGWKEHFFKQIFKKGCSDVMALAGNVVQGIFRNVGSKPSCPLPKGFYQLQNFPMIIDIKGIPLFWYGKYKARTYGIDKEGLNALCFEATVDIVPKSTKH